MIPQGEVIRIFIGFDIISTVAYHVYVNSLIRHSSEPVSITPFILRHYKSNVLTRPRDQKQSNEFAFSRWLVPWLCNYQGWAIFTDNDMLMRADIAELWRYRDYRCAVQVVKHDYVPVERTKFLGREQTAYRRKNWSSVMLFNCRECGDLTPDYVNSASGLDLHQFQWLPERKIGALPRAWNHLVGVYPYDEDAKLVHFTTGGPWLEEYAEVDYADEWFKELKWTQYALKKESSQPSETAGAA